MSHTAWVMIGIAIFSCSSGIVLWLIRRRLSRLDALELAVFGDAVKHPGLNIFATRAELEKRAQAITEDVDKRLTMLSASMAGISEEGQKREERILEAIRSNNNSLVGAVQDLKQDVRNQVSELRNDVRGQASRVDDLMRQNNGGR